VDTIQELVMFSLFAMYTSLFLPSLSWPFEDSGVVMIISSAITDSQWREALMVFLSGR